MVPGRGVLGGFLAAAGEAEGDGESEREKETPPGLERVDGDSLSLEKRGGGGLEAAG